MSRLAVLAVLTAVVASSAQTVSADERNFRLINESSVVILDVYVSASQLADWGDDLLGVEVLWPGEAADILFSRFDGESGNCLYDIRVVGTNGEDAFEGVLYDVNLCETDSVSFTN